MRRLGSFTSNRELRAGAVVHISELNLKQLVRVEAEPAKAAGLGYANKRNRGTDVTHPKMVNLSKGNTLYSSN